MEDQHRKRDDNNHNAHANEPLSEDSVPIESVIPPEYRNSINIEHPTYILMHI